MTATVAEEIRSRLQVRTDLPCPEQRRALRTSAGLSQQELADAVGVTRQAVSHWESGIRTPRGAVLDRYIDAIRALREAIA
ncbi:helix-turn-helix transcriptional regulator [Streptomyces lydicus]|uniref:helix-turn-helix transcriptional regulator n=1 Tax=Streptomyces lydicus TaxID=47763 RepID=UPI0037AD82C8